MILQITQPTSALTFFNDTFLQYGVLGAVALVLGYFAWASYTRLVEKNDTLEKKVDALQAEMTSLLKEERDRMASIIQENTRAINDLRSLVVSTLLQKNEK